MKILYDAIDDREAALNKASQKVDDNNPKGVRKPISIAIRTFIQNRDNGEPVAGQILDFYFLDAQEQERALGSLASDHTGYTSLKAELPPDTQKVIVRVRGGGAADLMVSPTSDFSSAWQIPVNVAAVEPSRLSGSFPSIIDADHIDHNLSPASFSVLPRPYPPFGLCSQLIPSSLTTRRYTFMSVEFECGTLAGVICGIGTRRDQVIQRGKIHTYRQTWQPKGFSLGGLLNSFSLAPCEQIKIGSYSRLKGLNSFKNDSLTQSQSESASNSRHATTTNSVDWAVKRGWNVSLGAVIKGVPVSVGFGQPTVQTPKSTITSLSDSVIRSATASFDYLSTSIFELSESESGSVQTRILTNNNHCHMLNVMYYALNENYRVVTEYVGSRKVVFIRINPIDINVEAVFASRHLLKGNLLDSALEGCMDVFEEYFCCAKSTVPQIAKLRVLMTLGNRHTGGTVWIRLKLKDGTFLEKNLTLNSWVPGTEHVTVFDLIGATDPSNVTAIEIGTQVQGVPLFESPVVLLSNIKVEYQASSSSNWTGLSQASSVPVYASQTWTDNISIVSPPKQEEEGCDEAKCCIENLMRHINGNKAHYMCLLLSNIDHGHILAEWCSCHAEGREVPMIQGEPLGVVHVGNDYWLVMAEEGSVVVPDPSVPKEIVDLAVPSPGVFSEALLGSCNSCEKIENDRFWKWDDAPCSSAPDLKDVTSMTGSGVKPSDFAFVTPTSMITTQTWPDPLGTASLADLAKSLAASAEAGSKEAQANLNKVLEVLKDIGKAAVKAWQDNQGSNQTGSGTDKAPSSDGEPAPDGPPGGVSPDDMG
ncbi:MAG: hypothetical protein KF784_07280 [Fimbriimonadaceae bacterium]|nr:hypothetical protein [Fimbriimonadaceae bacterium]